MDSRDCVHSYKSKSPSSGLFRVRVYDEHGNPSRTGTGIFPRAVMQRFPLLPLEEEGRLNDLPLRENFIERVFAYFRWTEMLKNEPTPGGLVRFHTAHKLTLMAHSIKHYQELVPLTLLQHHFRRHPVPDWLHQQVYLNPYPKELMLRNHV